MKFQLFTVLVFSMNTSYLLADSETKSKPEIKVDIIDDSVSSDHFSDEMDVRRSRGSSNEHALPELAVQDALWKKAGVEKEIKDYDFLTKDKLYFYLDELYLELEDLQERFPEISEGKMKLLMKLRRGE